MVKKTSTNRSLFLLVSIFLSFSFSATSLAHGWKAPPKDAARKNPIILDQGSILNGRDIYFQYCSHCHGDTGKGLDSRSTGLTQHTPNLPERLENHSEGDFHWKIKTGRREMPSFDGDLSDTDVWNIINWIKSQSE